VTPLARFLVAQPSLCDVPLVMNVDSLAKVTFQIFDAPA
jgi:hypothetical protein